MCSQSCAQLRRPEGQMKCYHVMGSGLSLGSVLGIGTIQVFPMALQVPELCLKRSTEACIGS